MILMMRLYYFYDWKQINIIKHDNNVGLGYMVEGLECHGMFLALSSGLPLPKLCAVGQLVTFEMLICVAMK